MDGISVQDLVITCWCLGITLILLAARDWLTYKGSFWLSMRHAATILSIMLDWPLAGCVIVILGNLVESQLKDDHPHLFFTKEGLNVLRTEDPVKTESNWGPVMTLYECFFVILGSYGDDWMLIAW